MSDLMRHLGVDASSNLSVFVFCAIFTMAVITLIWVIGLLQGNHSMIDGWYGFGYVVPALFSYLIVRPESVTAALLLFMVMLHGLRLGWYLAARWRRYLPVHGGDPRYLGFAKKFQPGYWWKSFFRVVEPQGVAIIVIGSPVIIGILNTRDSGGPITLLAFVGLLVFMVGFYFETVADTQLQAFLALETRPRYLNTGVWKYSRHPNYFGTTTLWWGIWLVAVGGNPASWWTIAGPVMNTLMLTAMFGSKFQDDYMGARPEYQELMVRTRKFFPIPLSDQAIARNRERLAGQRARTHLSGSI
jgi:steroid 5-alpha reductase family enzyme